MAARTWTDDQLKEAVVRAHSWRGVCRFLGLKGTSAGVLRVVRQRAAQLELDTTHFTHQRRWTDRELRQAVERASTWADVIAELRLIDTGGVRARVKGHAIRVGLDVSHLQREHSPPSVAGLTPRPECLRAAAEPIAAAWFVLRGVPVASPTEPAAYDMLVTLPEGIRRVQVKSGTRRSDTGGYVVAVGRRYSTGSSSSLAPYDPDEIDYFFIVDGAGGLYLVPIAVLAGLVGIDTTAYSEYKVGEAADLIAHAAA